MWADVAREGAALLGAPIGELARAHAGWVARGVAWSAVVAVPAGVIAARMPTSQRTMLRLLGVISSVPALAWLAVCTAVLESAWATLGFVVLCTAPPLVRGVLDGVRAIDPGLTDVARAIGLGAPRRLRFVLFPKALPGLSQGLREAFTYGSAATTLAAVAGAGGFGRPILEGLAAGDARRMLAGALAATLFTFALRFTVTAAQRLSPPLWGASPFHRGTTNGGVER